MEQVTGQLLRWERIGLRAVCNKSSANSVDRGPLAGDRAEGHGVSGTIMAVPKLQPLEGDGIWRVALYGEHFGRLVRRRGQGQSGAPWELLQIDDMSDAQLDAYDAAMLGVPQGGAWAS